MEDARCLINLALPSKIRTMVDPFAGAGGIVYQAKYMDKNIEVFSVDTDKTLEPIDTLWLKALCWQFSFD